MATSSRTKNGGRFGVLLILTVLAMSVALLVVSRFSIKTSPPSVTSDAPFVISEISSPVVSTSFQHKTTYTVDPRSRILLIPHHLVAGREIASLLAAAPARAQVLLLSPDHFTLGKQALSTTLRSFERNEKRIPNSTALTTRLLTELQGDLQAQDDVFVREHGVRGLLPFIQTAWPNSAVTPITVRLDTADATIEHLARALFEELKSNQDLTVLITIDFSHDLPAYLADLHDRQAIKALQDLAISASSLVEIDSPPLFRLLTRLTTLQNASLELQAHTNSLRLMNARTSTLGTSHVLISQRPEPAIASPAPRFTFFHDPARKIVSSENRAYRGYDESVISSIPLPAVFVKEDWGDESLWSALPLEQNAVGEWRLVSDQTFQEMRTQREEWQRWAAKNLSSNDTE